MVWGDCMEGVGRLSEGFGEAMLMMWGGYLEDVGKLC